MNFLESLVQTYSSDQAFIYMLSNHLSSHQHDVTQQCPTISTIPPPSPNNVITIMASGHHYSIAVITLPSHQCSTTIIVTPSCHSVIIITPSPAHHCNTIIITLLLHDHHSITPLLLHHRHHTIAITPSLHHSNKSSLWLHCHHSISTMASPSACRFYFIAPLPSYHHIIVPLPLHHYTIALAVKPSPLSHLHHNITIPPLLTHHHIIRSSRHLHHFHPNFWYPSLIPNSTSITHFIKTKKTTGVWKLS